MKIAIVSYYFAPANLMGAIRPTALAREWMKQGHEVEIITSRRKSWLFLERQASIDMFALRGIDESKLLCVDNSMLYRCFSWLVWTMARSSGVSNSRKVSSKDLRAVNFKSVAKKTAFWIMSIIQDVDWAIVASLKSKSILNNSDVVFSTSGPLSSHLVQIFTRSTRNWIADFRDPLALPHDLSIQKRLNEFITQYILLKANSVSVVSLGYKEMLTANKTLLAKCRVVYNGFESVDISDAHVSSDTFRIFYAGTTYGGKRDLSPLFLAFSKMEKRMQESIEFVYAGPEGHIVQEWKEKYCGNIKLLDLGLVSRSVVLQEYLRVNMLIVATWNDIDYKGVIPGKVFELMPYGLPILNFVSSSGGPVEIIDVLGGNNRNCLSYVIGQTAIEQLIQYLKTEINGQNRDRIIDPFFNKYNYSNVAKTLIDLVK